MNKKNRFELKPLGKGSSPQTGKISDSELARITNIPKATIISWKKRDKDNWRKKHYWLLKSMTKEELENQIKKSLEISKVVEENEKC